MKKNMLNKLKRVMATVMMACMLLTVVNVSSDAVDSVVPYGQELDGGRGELN
ncbi:MAG: hypothetical protein IKU69_05610 [Roseburia sp.]|nr:hypothetical protein [Roseburia sp.]